MHLYDAAKGRLVPVSGGDAIRVHPAIPDLAAGEPIDVALMRPLAVNEMLRRVLEGEGLYGTLVNPPGPDGETLYEPFGAYARDGTDEVELTSSRCDPGPCVEVQLTGASGGQPVQARAFEGWPALSDVLYEDGRGALMIYLLGAHYSDPLPHPVEALPEAVAKAERVREVAAWLDPEEPSPKHMKRHVWALRKALAWNLETPRAFRALFRWLRAAEQHDGPVGDKDLREMLGLLVLDVLLEE